MVVSLKEIILHVALNEASDAETTKILNYNLSFFLLSKLFSETSLTWYDARDYCRAIGGDLLSIHSFDEQKVPLDRYSVTKLVAV